MLRLSRQLLTWLLLAAVPLQGYAAGAMLFCGAAHGRAEAAAVDHAAHGHGAHAPDTAAHHSGPATVDHQQPAPAADLASLLHGTCSVCASCCSGAALPAAIFVSAFATERAAPALPGERPAPDRAPARLERPPRIALA
jgi:hypothetical protein